MKTRILTLRLKEKWWRQIQSGVKTTEIRLATDYWARRLEGRKFDEVHLWLGYPHPSMREKLLIRKWLGTERQTITHEEFGTEPVDVFVISLGAMP